VEIVTGAGHEIVDAVDRLDVVLVDAMDAEAGIAWRMVPMTPASDQLDHCGRHFPVRASGRPDAGRSRPITDLDQNVASIMGGAPRGGSIAGDLDESKSLVKRVLRGSSAPRG
jgi:hypothetical protein